MNMKFIGTELWYNFLMRYLKLLIRVHNTCFSSYNFSDLANGGCVKSTTKSSYIFNSFDKSIDS